MNRNFTQVLLLFMLLLFNSCKFMIRSYDYSYEYHSEYSYEDGRLYTDKRGRVLTDANLRSNEDYSLLHSYFQPIFPKWRENYKIEMQVERYDRDTDIEMRYMYLEECRIVLPFGEAIDLLDNIVLYIHRPPKQEYETPQNVKPQYINNKKAIYIEGLAPKDSVSIRSNAAIPSIIDSIRFEYTLTVVWKNSDAVKKRCKMTFRKKVYTYNPFIV